MVSMRRRILSLFTSAVIVGLAAGTTPWHTRAQAQGGQLRWAKAAPFPEPEEELYGTVINGKLYVVGGFGFNPFGSPAGLVYEYDPGTDKWTKKKEIPVKVHHQAQTTVNGKLYILGGCLRAISGEMSSTNAWEFDPVADTYKALAPIPDKRCSAQAEAVNGKIYLIGGIMPMENGKGTRVTGLNQMYDPATNRWENRSPMPTSRNHAFSGVVNNKIYVIGGRIGAGNIPATSNVDVVEEYDPAENLWGAIRQRMPTPRSGGGVATYNGKIYVSGGELQTRQLAAAFRALEAYDAAKDEWTILPSMPSARHGNASGFIGNKLHIVSGKMEGGGEPDMAGTEHPYATAAHDVLEIP
jgi:N-acetylneuraminic acid mutarotase